jgi:hypothetical protein
MAVPMIERVREAWRAAGREEEPRFAGLVYYGLSDEAASYASLRRYYGFIPDYADAVAASALRSPAAIQEAVKAYTDAGFTELALMPTVPSIDEVDRLAEVVF